MNKIIKNEYFSTTDEENFVINKKRKEPYTLRIKPLQPSNKLINKGVNV